MGRIIQSSFLRALLVLVSGTTLAQVIPFAISPILTRIYSPEDLGVLALYTSFVAVFTGAMSLGFAYAIVSAHPEDEEQLLALCVQGVIVTLLPVSVVIFCLIKFNLLGFGALSIWVMPIIVGALCFSEVFFVLRYYALRESRFGDISTATVAQGIARSLSQVVLGLINFGWLGITLGDVAGRSVGMSRLWRGILPKLKSGFKGWSVRKSLALASKYKDFLKYSASGSVIDSLSAQMVPPLLAAEFGLGLAGQYGIVSRLMLLPATLIGAAVADVFHQRLSGIYRERPESGEPFFLKVAAGLLLLSVTFSSVVLWFGEDIWVTILGAQWQTAGAFAIAMVPRAAVVVVSSPLSRALLVYGGQKVKLIYNISSVIAVLGATYLAVRSGMTAVDAVMLISWTQAIMATVYFCSIWFVVRKSGESDSSR